MKPLSKSNAGRGRKPNFVLQIASAKSRSVRGFPIYLVHEKSWYSMVSYDWANGGSVGVFFRHGMVKDC